MKARIYPFMLVLAMTMAVTAAAFSTRAVLAACGGQQQPPCPEKEKKPTATDVPVTATPTDTPTPVSPVAACGTPDADQLKLLCASVPPPTGAGEPSSSGQSLNKPPNPNVPTVPPFPGPISLSGILIGLLTGILIGLLLPAVMRVFSWGAGQGGIIGPVDSWHKEGEGIISPTDAKWQKYGGEKWQKSEYIKFDGSDFNKLAPPPPGSVGEFNKLAPPPPGSVGNAGPSGSQNIDDIGFAK